MPKIITSPVKHFPGTVTLSDPLTFPQTFAFEDAIKESKSLSKDATLRRFHYALLPGILACVEKWDLKDITNPTRDTFPSTPDGSVVQLLTWLLNAITALHKETTDIPNV